MNQSVRTLRLSGLDAGEALQTVKKLLTDRMVPDLRNLLVLDDTATLAEHAIAFQDLLASRRMHYLLCVAIGPPVAGRRQIVVPGSIGSGQGSAVIWVGDPLGVDWPLSAAAVALVRPPRARSGLDHLIEVLCAAEVFNRVRELIVDLPGGVASPGLRIAGATEDAASFPAALTAAIRRYTRAPAGADELEPLISAQEAQEARQSEVRLAERGNFSVAHERCCAGADEAVSALLDLTRLGGMLTAGRLAAGIRATVTATGEALQSLRDQICSLLEYAHAPAGLNEQQRDRIRNAGLVLPGASGASRPGGGPTRDQASGQGAAKLAEAVSACIRSGATLPEVTGRLVQTERRLAPQGSRAYLPEVDRRCPQPLVQHFTDPPRLPGLPPWLPLAAVIAAVFASVAGLAGIPVGLIIVLAWTVILALSVRDYDGSVRPAGLALAVNLLAGLTGVAAGAAIGRSLKPSVAVIVTGVVLAVVILAATAILSWQSRAHAWREALSPGRAADVANELIELVTRRAGADWSTDTALLDMVARTRVTIQGVENRLQDFAGEVDKGRTSSSQDSRLSGALLPTLRQLVLAVLTARPGQGHQDGQAVYRQARVETGDLIDTWVATAAERGPLAWPPFAVAEEQDLVVAADEELAAITAVTTYDPYATMCQLCTPSELGTLDTGVRPGVVAFAPQGARRQQERSLPTGTVWTALGQRAGLLRLVPLRTDSVQLDWSADAGESASDG